MSRPIRPNVAYLLQKMPVPDSTDYQKERKGGVWARGEFGSSYREMHVESRK